MLCEGSLVSEASEVATPTCFATACAVNGMSCISPRAPEGLTAPISKLLSWRISPSATDGSIGPSGGSAAIGQPDSGRTSPSRPMQRPWLAV
jgi:hypothetical protein